MCSFLRGLLSDFVWQYSDCITVSSMVEPPVLSLGRDMQAKKKKGEQVTRQYAIICVCYVAYFLVVRTGKLNYFLRKIYRTLINVSANNWSYMNVIPAFDWLTPLHLPPKRL